MEYQHFASTIANIAKYPTLANFPTTGNDVTLYIDKSNNTEYHWDNGSYKAIGGGGSVDLSNYVNRTTTQSIAGNKTFTGDTTLGNVTLGGDIIPDGISTRNLGNATNRYNTLWANFVLNNAGSLQIGVNTSANSIQIRQGNTNQIIGGFHPTTGNFFLQSAGVVPTDSGYRLDVNGDGKFTGAVRIIGTATIDGFTYIRQYSTSDNFLLGTMKLGANNPANSSSILELFSTTKGFLPPRLTTSQKNAISSPADGLGVYDTDLKLPSFYNSTAFAWRTLVDGESTQIITGAKTFNNLLTILNTTEQLRLSYNGANYSRFTVSSAGNLTVQPSGGSIVLEGGSSTPLTVISSSNTQNLKVVNSSTAASGQGVSMGMYGTSGGITMAEIRSEWVGSSTTDAIFKISTRQGNILTESARLFTTGNWFFGTTPVDAGFKVDINGTARSNQYFLSALNTAPANATSTGVLGEIRWTSTYVYLCTATNTWVRAALATW